MFLLLPPILLPPFRGIPYDKNIDPAYLNGPMTASGIFLGFLTVAMISKSEAFGIFHYFLVELNFAAFFFAILFIFDFQLRNGPVVGNLSWLMASVNLNVGTATIFIYRLLKARLHR